MLENTCQRVKLGDSRLWSSSSASASHKVVQQAKNQPRHPAVPARKVMRSGTPGAWDHGKGIMTT
jgi:hypothetical protein